jgi:hypothetical protein
MKMRFTWIALSMVAMLVSANSAKADRQIAFVAGNGAYTNMQPLPNAPISAKAMTGLLQSAGFDVVQAIEFVI